MFQRTKSLGQRLVKPYMSHYPRALLFVSDGAKINSEEITVLDGHCVRAEQNVLSWEGRGGEGKEGEGRGEEEGEGEER